MGKSRKAFYAVRVGREVGVFNTWAECQAQVTKFPGAVFKGFPDLSQAQAFVSSSPTTRAREVYGGTSTRASYSTPAARVASYSQPPAARASGANGTSHSGIYNSGHPSSVASYDRPVKMGHNHPPVTPVSQSVGPGSGVNTPPGTQPTASHGHCVKTMAMHAASSHGGGAANEQKCPVVYCDGCCFNNGRVGARAGIGVFWGHGSPHNISEGLEGAQTNQRAELVSAYRAIQSATDRGYSAVEIKTDSNYTIKSVTEWMGNWKRNGWKTSQAKPVKNREDIERLDSACQKIHVKWTHVPGHCGIAGNEAADQLAKAGSNK